MAVQVGDDVANNQDDTDNTTHKKPSKSSKKSKPKDDQDAAIMSDIKDCLGSINQNVAKKADEDNHTLWARVLANKLRSMDDMLAEELKLKIDSIVLEAMKTNK